MAESKRYRGGLEDIIAAHSKALWLGFIMG